MQDNMDKMFQRMHQRIQQRTTGQIAPLGTYQIQDQSNFIDKGTQYEYVTNIPQSKEKQIDVHSANGIVSITAKIIQNKETKTAHGFSSSSSMRMYQQKLALPINADENTLNMSYKNGFLVLTIDKKKTQKKKIESKVSNTDMNTTKKEEVKKEKIKLSDDTSMS